MNKRLKILFSLAGAVLAALVAMELLRGAKPAPSEPVIGTDLQGRPWELAEHLGKRPVVINFFATWCSPCREEFPELLRLEGEYKNRGLELVVMSEEDAPTLKAAGLDRAPIRVLPQMRPAFQQFGVEGIPRTLYFGPDGKLATDLEGYDPAGIRRIGETLAAMPVLARSEADTRGQ